MPMRAIKEWTSPNKAMAGLITVWLMVLFSLSYLVPVLEVSWIKSNAAFDTGLQQTLLVLLVAAIGYYINTSKSADDKTDIISKQVDNVRTANANLAAAVGANTNGTGNGNGNGNGHGNEHGPLAAAAPTGTSDDPVSVVVEKKT